MTNYDSFTSSNKMFTSLFHITRHFFGRIRRIRDTVKLLTLRLLLSLLFDILSDSTILTDEEVTGNIYGVQYMEFMIIQDYSNASLS